MDFSQLNLKPNLLRAVSEAGYTQPSPIQEQAIPPVLEGRDLLGCAQTGTGKTAAFALPILQRLSEQPVKGRPIRALVLTPTRELALQIEENFELYAKYEKLSSTVIFGGVGQGPQVAALRRGVDILVATPGRLNDLIGQGHIKLDRVEIFVLDEADRMLDMGFVHDVRRVIEQLPQKRQTLLFSATLPKEIQSLAGSLLDKPAKVFVTPVSSTVESVEQSVYKIDKANKRHLLAKLLKDPAVHSALVFTRTKHGADRVARDLAKAGVPAAAIHGNKSQGARQTALARFKEGKVKALVATDIAARGIDIHELSHVFNYDLPNVPETYVHRIGRTGRAGHEGIAVSFSDAQELEYLADIEKLIGFKVPVADNPEWPMKQTAAEMEAVQKARKAEQQAQRDASRAKKRGDKVPRTGKEAAPKKEAKPKAPAAPSGQKAAKNSAKPAGRAQAPAGQTGQKRGGKPGGKRRDAGPRQPFDTYDNRTGGSAIVTKKPAWSGEDAGAPSAQSAAGQQGDDSSMSRGRRRGGKNRRKNQKPGENKPGAPVIPKNPKGLFDFSEEELAEDSSLKVISRKEDSEQKYASFEDFLKDQQS